MLGKEDLKTGLLSGIIYKHKKNIKAENRYHRGHCSQHCPEKRIGGY